MYHGCLSCTNTVSFNTTVVQNGVEEGVVMIERDAFFIYKDRSSRVLI